MSTAVPAFFRHMASAVGSRSALSGAVKPEYLCFFLSLLCAIPLIFLTPPFQAPDEAQHFYKAYQVSELNLVGTIENGKGGGSLPSSLIELSTHYLGTRAIHADRPLVKRTISSVASGTDIKLVPGVREHIDFTGAAFYSPIPYIPQALAIGAGRVFDASPLVLFYAGRILNCFVAIFLLSLAVRTTPIAKSVFMVAGLLPMSVFLFASLSPDALVIGSAFLFVAIALKAHYERVWTFQNVAVAIVCGSIFCSIKIVYAPLLLLCLPTIWTVNPKARTTLISVLIISIPVIVTALWLHSVSALVMPARAGTSVSIQAQHVIQHPLLFMVAIAHSFVWNKFYFFDTIGVLGWSTIQLPAISYFLAVLGLAIAVFFTRQPLSKIQFCLLAWWAAICAACVLLIMLALFLYWTRVGAPAVDGVQGRYFLPIIPLAALVIHGLASRIAYPRADLSVGIGVIVAIQAILTFSSLISSYWLP